MIGSFLFTFVNQLNLSSNCRDDPLQITHPDHGLLFFIDQCSALCSAKSIFQCSDGQTSRDATFLIDKLTLSCFKCNLFYDTCNKIALFNHFLLSTVHSCFLSSDAQCGFHRFWIVCKYLTFDSVFKRRYNRTTVGIIFWIGSEYKNNIQRKSQLKTTNLNIPFLKNIKEGNLNPCLQIRKFIDYKDATVTSWNDAVVNYSFIREIQPQVRCFYRINIPDKICDRHIRSSQLLTVALAAVQPFNWCIITQFCNCLFPKIRNGMKGIIMDITSRNIGNVFIQ